MRDKASRFIPRAVAGREIFMRVGRPVEVSGGDSPASQTNPMLEVLDQHLRDALEAARLDGLARLVSMGWRDLARR